jgi:hypothetical protein
MRLIGGSGKDNNLTSEDVVSHEIAGGNHSRVAILNNIP